MLGAKMATCNSMLRHQKAEPSNENESHRWKWTNKPIWTKMLQKTKTRYAMELLYLVSFINPQKLFLLEHLVKAEGAHSDNACPRKDHKDQAASRKFHIKPPCSMRRSCRLPCFACGEWWSFLPGRLFSRRNKWRGSREGQVQARIRARPR